MASLAIVGSGPMTLYALKHLKESPVMLEIHIYELSEVAGTGMPYRAGMNSDDMLCNAFSREIPYVTQPLIHWLESLPARELNEWELSWHDISPRAFYPRVLIGEYLQSEFEAACEALRMKGHKVSVTTKCKVIDIVPEEQGFTLQCLVDSSSKAFHCDDVLIATGHVWSETPELHGIKLVSPWPYTNITKLPPASIGVLGSSLSAVDVLVALGQEHGTFTENQDVSWKAKVGTERLKIRMISLRAVMPEGDFYYPFPYQPLERITNEAVIAEVAKGQDNLLERVFKLLLEELDHADPNYLRELGPDARTIPGFADAYFTRRERLGGLAAVKRDLAETRKSLRERKTIPHRYALLRGHEAFDLALRHLSDEDYATFQNHLMPVFGDCYAAVPHLSLSRVIALYDAGVLELSATATDSAFESLEGGKTQVLTEDGPLVFDHIIDARGQAPHPVSALPFSTLVAALKDTETPLNEPFRLELKHANEGSVYCLAIPQVLERFPFSQGLPDCHDLAEIAVADLLASV
ncbi:MAG: FAD/NAD(P)-binding protein [Trueperaceae bacterium]